MRLKFQKYQGTGNDFVMIDNRSLTFSKNNTKLIEQLCDRRFGIGADGLILLENDNLTDFKMVYYNSDGNESSMCGNGGRCLTAFAKGQQVIVDQARFVAVDGLHTASIDAKGIVSLQMIDVEELSLQPDYVFLNTGSPHHVTLVPDVAQINVKAEGAAIRYSELYGSAGSNVNFVQQLGENHFRLRTYERGVEDETLSCGTGATAVAIAMHALGKATTNHIDLEVQGGALRVSFEYQNGKYTNVHLIGPATFVFEGEIEVE
ncbi:MAG: Diaminopimelate epimerase [Bacteroidota bacterium]|jgi:diaminopimelate epimerase